MSLAPSVTHASPVHQGRIGHIALWVVQVALAGMFLLAGSSKLFGAAAMVGLFDAIGIGQWFRYLTGLIEVSSAVALLVPSFAVFGALDARRDDDRRDRGAPVHRRRLASDARDPVAWISRRPLGSSAATPWRLTDGALSSGIGRTGAHA